jgi:hypothetical protein
MRTTGCGSEPTTTHSSNPAWLASRETEAEIRLRFAYLAYVHLCAQSKAGTMYQARKAKIASTMITIAVYLIAAYPARRTGDGIFRDCG